VDDGGIDVLPSHGEIPASRRAASNGANRRSTTPVRVRCSRNSQRVLASGPLSSSAKPTKRMNESRSFSWYAVWSSERV
jgi:hypothetical protein